MFRLVRRLPIFRVLAIAQIALLARRHLQQLQPHERRRLVELARGARHLSAQDKDELRGLVSKLDAGAFAGSAMRRMSPIGFRRFR